MASPASEPPSNKPSTESVALLLAPHVDYLLILFQAIYTCTNARVQTTSLLLQAGFNTGIVGQKIGKEDPQKLQLEGIKYLSDRECKDAWEANSGHAYRPWKLWCAEVANATLYKNELGPPPGA